MISVLFAMIAIQGNIEEQSAREWLQEEYLPRISGEILYVGVGSYTQSYYQLVKTPETFKTVDLDETKKQFGSPFGHYVMEFLDMEPKGEYDHCCLFGVMGHPPTVTTSIYTIFDDEMIERVFWHADKMIKVGGTLQLGPNYRDVPEQDAEFWTEKFKQPPLDKYEIICSTRGKDNMIWWGRKVVE